MPGDYIGILMTKMKRKRSGKERVYLSSPEDHGPESLYLLRKAARQLLMGPGRYPRPIRDSTGVVNLLPPLRSIWYVSNVLFVVD